MEIISVLNRKGGVGKTTTVINLGVALNREGFNILLIDCDAQGNCTSGIGFLETEVNTIFNVLLGEIPITKAIYEVKPYQNLDIIPFDKQLDNIETELKNEYRKEEILQNKFEKQKDKLSEKYDYILIDNSPALDLLTKNTMICADSLIIPLESGGFSIEGLEEMLQHYNQIKEKGINPDLTIKGVLLTRADNRTNLERKFKQKLKDIFKDQVFSTVINQNVDIKNSTMNNESVFEYDPKAQGSIDYKKLAKEVIEIDR